LTFKKKDYVSYQEAKKFARSLKFENHKQWAEYAKSEKKPKNIPADPYYYYGDEFEGYPEFLGTKTFASMKGMTNSGKKLTYAQAKEALKNYHLIAVSEYKALHKANKLPNGCVLVADRTYSEEWDKNGGWYGYLSIDDNPNLSDVDKLKIKRKFISNSKKSDKAKSLYLSFEMARDLARNIAKINDINTKDKWVFFVKSNILPDGVPSDPYNEYKNNGWIGWPDWLGVVRYNKRNKASYQEAKEYAQSLNLNKSSQWEKLSKEKKHPINIPHDPRAAYPDEFEGMHIFLGTGNKPSIGRNFRPFIEARAYARTLKFINKNQWSEFSKTPEFPDDIPTDPSQSYSNEWLSWPDWLGHYHKWTKAALLSYLKNITPLIDKFEPKELFEIASKSNFLKIVESLDDGSPIKNAMDFIWNNETEKAKELLTTIDGVEISEDDINQLAENDFTLNDQITEETKQEDYLNRESDELPYANVDFNKSLEDLEEIELSGTLSSDEETVEYLIRNRVGKQWLKVFKDETFDVNKINSSNFKGKLPKEVIKRFKDEYQEANNLIIPDGYDFKIDGVPKPPSLMQKLIAHRISNDRRIGNWSGTGAGKTISALLASEYIKSKLTVVIGLNNTIIYEDSGWPNEIKKVFPKSNILIKDKKNIQIDPNKSNYLLLNYESFQLDDSKELVEEIVNNHKVDMIVIDEIHSAKSNKQIPSKRRQLINYLLTEAAKKNPNLAVLGMSATPVINTLDEGVSLIEMVTGKDYSDLDTADKNSNALNIHKHLVINGIRYMPDYKMQLNEKEIEIEDQTIYEDLKQTNKGQILQMEQILFESKKDTIKSLLKPGTIIYSHFVDEIFPKLINFIKNCGFTVAEFSGQEKSGLKAFKERKVDILLGSSALSTGINGLQYVCNRMIIVTLPWTSAAYEQLVGRIYRQGSKFEEIEIFIPQVHLNHKGNKWSWDAIRHGRIKYKKTLSDAAVDGVIPDKKLAKPEKMLEEAKQALHDWIARLENDGEVYEFSRRPLKIPLPPDVVKKGLQQYGDFSLMNQRINTSKSSTTHERFSNDPEEWFQYHTLYREARKDWTEIPFEKIAQSINKRPRDVIGDFGCGEADLSKLISNKVYSFDHVAANPSVVVCDMANIDLPDETLDVAVFSLSLMGVNWEDYLKEAFRLMVPGGHLKIAEPQNRWADGKLDLLINGIRQAGFAIQGEPSDVSSRFIYIDATKPF